jgi:hypothetical protein
LVLAVQVLLLLLQLEEFLEVILYSALSLQQVVVAAVQKETLMVSAEVLVVELEEQVRQALELLGKVLLEFLA